MNKIIIVSEKAAREIRKAVEWYDEESIGLGDELIARLEYYYNKIKKYPDSYKRVNKTVQRCLMKKFPYIIFFTSQENKITILRVRHAKQKPLKRYR
ncbi:MAG TPA: type II toxin-antitoxin system RelE/ParE family toxin [Chitinophagaceae bacterium]|nr:type II toxin-antitoxin system RelE/ParE family toxin [Chitinophagaceae bacterium]